MLFRSKIDAVLAQAKDLGLSTEQITKLQKAKEELAASGGNATQVVVKIKRVYQINLDLLDAKNQKILSEISKLESRLLLLEPKIDDIIQPKFDTAKSLLYSLKDPTSTDDPIKLLRALDSAIKEIESYLLSLQTQPMEQSVSEQSETLKTQTKDIKLQAKTAKEKDITKKQSLEISRIEAKLVEIGRAHV